jgi:hypothetical protein
MPPDQKLPASRWIWLPAECLRRMEKGGRWTLGRRTVNRLSSRSNTEFGSGAIVFEGATKGTSNAESVVCYVDAMRGFETALGDALTIGVSGTEAPTWLRSPG